MNILAIVACVVLVVVVATAGVIAPCMLSSMLRRKGE